MGRNFYLGKIITEKDKLDMIMAIMKDEFGKAVMLIEENAKIHIGKSSGGWRFIFNHNNWKYYTTKDEMKEWLKTGLITDDEYTGVVYTFEEFWKMVEDKQNEYQGDWIEIFGLTFSPGTNFS